MKREYHVFYSHVLGRNLEILVFGHGGRPMMVFPSSDGRFFDFENFGMIETIAPFIESGKIQVFCPDSIDGESWYANKHPADKARRANEYDKAIAEEVVPFVHRLQGRAAGLIAHGCSFGAFHAANFYLRHPDQFEIGILLSGNYRIDFATGGYCDENVYLNEPLKYLPNLSNPWFFDQLRKNLLIICCGQGAWEDWRGEAQELAEIMRAKGLPCLFDMWGDDVCHDWPWWKRQIIYFLGKLDRAGMLDVDRPLDPARVNHFISEIQGI
ncbi:MAG: alpha/beta hydrolase-fold protein [Candidatus Ozemobacteraceae bacterium]